MNWFERAEQALAVLGQDIRDGAGAVERLVLQAETLAGTVSTAVEQERALPPADIAVVAQSGAVLNALLHIIGPAHPDFAGGKVLEPDPDADTTAAVLAGRKLENSGSVVSTAGKVVSPGSAA
jgi:hypothetical protein